MARLPASRGNLNHMSDAILVVSFGGPDGPDDVMPFLENVLRGRNVPRERMLEVAEHYQHFGGRSPINGQNRELIAALRELLDREGPHLPIYWGNRNWHPLLPDTFARMKEDGITRAICFMTSAYSSYSGCRQYRENVIAAQQGTGIETLKLRVFYNHPGFIEPMVERTAAALAAAPGAALIFTAHSVPMSMAGTSGYVKQLEEASRLVATGAGCLTTAWSIKAAVVRPPSPGSNPTFAWPWNRPPPLGPGTPSSSPSASSPTILKSSTTSTPKRVRKPPA